MTKKLQPTGPVSISSQRDLASIELTDGQENFSLEMPIEPFLILAGRLCQRMLSAQYDEISGAEVLKRKPVLMPKTFDIATLDLPRNPPVVLVLDGGAAIEISFAIPLDQAFAVGEAICQRANDLKVQKGSATAAPRTPS
jgi:hypothetical protein